MSEVFRNVLVALDLSPASRAALRRARALLEPDGTLHLLHVIDSAIETSAPRHSTPESMDVYLRQREQEAAAVIDGLMRDLLLDAPGLQVRAESRLGRPVDEILGTAVRLKADLVVVSAHGKNVFDRFVLGSVAEEVARQCSVPTLVVRELPQAAQSIGRVLVPVDLGDPSREAVRIGSVVARRVGAPLEILHVVNARTVRASGAPDPSLLDEDTREAVRVAPEAVAALVFGVAGVSRPRVTVLVGAPAQEILAAATPADLIVCGTHGRGVLGRLVFGSVAVHLLRHAPCPVVVVRQPPEPVSS